MTVRYTKNFLSQLEDIFAESAYTLRFEKGQFKSGWCLLHQKGVVIVNKFYPLEGRINCLLQILRELPIDQQELSPASRQLFQNILAQPV
ncbi:hypothetical protein [Persicobacter psychrovividus]|uniref:Uncharacterized protein n=1 Tax=Persicobacter psychrovividus TaxID=387638 RepID=A0ABM7VF99_9BACT|nr:hypothetical protein PEPS_18700 [Persicobacter psychrovividus]